MRRLLVPLFFAALASLSAASPAALPDDAVASVNGYVISTSLFHGLLENDLEVLARDGTQVKDRAPAAVLDELIDRALITAEAEARKIAPNESDLAQAEQSISSNFGSGERYADFLKRNHLSREQYLHEVVRPGICRERLAQSFAEEHPITDEQISAYYRAHGQDPDFQLPERVSVAHINLSLRHDQLAARLQHDDPSLTSDKLEQAVEAEKSRRRKLADDLLRQLQSGADFGELAAKYSDDPGTRGQGGAMEPFPRRAHPHEFEEAAFALQKPGELSSVVEDLYGLHIIKLREHSAPRAATLEEAAPEIRARLERSNQARLLNDWLREARAKAVIIKRDA